MNSKNCANCGTSFECGHPGECWCSDYPAIMPVGTGKQCLCPECLAAAQNKKINQLIESGPLDKAIHIAAKYRDAELIQNLDYTVENGKWVFSKWYHLKRGYCCYNDCKNCPYESTQ